MKEKYEAPVAEVVELGKIFGSSPDVEIETGDSENISDWSIMQ